MSRLYSCTIRVRVRLGTGIIGNSTVTVHIWCTHDSAASGPSLLGLNSGSGPQR